MKAKPVFESAQWQSVVSYFELTENVRQADDIRFSEILNRLRVGKPSPEDFVEVNSRVVYP